MVRKRVGEKSILDYDPSKNPRLSSDILVARVVVNIGKPIFTVSVLNISDDERIVREGTDMASCEIIDSVTRIGQTEDRKFMNVVPKDWTIHKKRAILAFGGI